jgi:hypothetical protein
MIFASNFLLQTLHSVLYVGNEMHLVIATLTFTILLTNLMKGLGAEDR